MLDYSSSFDRVPADTTDSTSSFAVSSGTADTRRRHVLQYLGRFEYPVELRTLAARVAAEERNSSIEAVSDDERERVAIRLHHVDIPKLVADSVVAYDPESRMVVGTATTRERYADASDRSRRSV